MPTVLKLLKMATGMRALLDTVVQALPQVWLCLLLSHASFPRRNLFSVLANCLGMCALLSLLDIRRLMGYPYAHAHPHAPAYNLSCFHFLHPDSHWDRSVWEMVHKPGCRSFIGELSFECEILGHPFLFQCTYSSAVSLNKSQLSLLCLENIKSAFVLTGEKKL